MTWIKTFPKGRRPEIEREGLPAEFAETIRSGWWTTCLENLPVKERVRGKF